MMGKARKATHGRPNAKAASSKANDVLRKSTRAAKGKVLKHSASQVNAKTSKSSRNKDVSAKNISNAVQQSQRLVPLPLDPASKILLIGEGDFSFAASLATHHGCEHLVATTYESPANLKEKHPTTSDECLAAILAAASTNKILYSIDATKLGLPSVPGGAELRKQSGMFDTVWFNFPHVGGKSTDVNRQVRANQALVVGFLEGSKRMLKPGGAVVVSLFEGMPYELWGVRNLARHVGLTVERSGRFEWERFPGYSHKRTLGDVEGGGGWKGEQRDARVYIFRKEGGETPIGSSHMRKNAFDESDEEDD